MNDVKCCLQTRLPANYCPGIIGQRVSPAPEKVGLSREECLHLAWETYSLPREKVSVNLDIIIVIFSRS